MEVSKAIRTGYYTALNGNVSVNGQNVPVYDVFALPEGASYPYILLSSQTSTQRVTKGCKVYDATIVIDIVTGDLNMIGRSQSEDIAEQVENLVNTTDINITANGYKIGDTNREGDTDDSNKNGQYYIFRKIMTYRHLISKL